MGATLKSKSGRTILRNLKSRMKRIRDTVDGVEVVAGFVRGKSSAFSIYKAYANEWGTSETDITSSDKGRAIVPRPFMQNSLPQMTKNLSSVFEGATTKGLKARMGTAGKVMELAIEESLSSGQFESNTAYTLARKQGTQPLIDTGAMRNDITSEVRRAK